MRVDPLCDPLDPESALGAKIFFEPGARTRWHRKPARTLIVISGFGRMRRAGGPIEEIAAGTVVRIPCGQKIWFGAAGSRAVTYIVLHGEAG
jgi:quercetin dioxygenase-like cupin family protein